MKKQDAISIFGTAASLARALGITPQGVGQWPEELTQQQIDRVVGACIRLGKLPRIEAKRPDLYPPP